MTSLELTDSGTAEFDEGDVYFIGNATTLIRFGGLTILTDPAFLHKGEHVYLGHGIWARREVEPACQIAELPPIDLIVLSHYHGDHFDDVAAQELDKKLPIVSTADAVGKLSGLGFEQGYPLDTWESLEVRKGEATLKITAMPAKHATEEAVNELLMPVNGHLAGCVLIPRPRRAADVQIRVGCSVEHHPGAGISYRAREAVAHRIIWPDDHPVRADGNSRT